MIIINHIIDGTGEVPKMATILINGTLVLILPALPNGLVIKVDLFVAKDLQIHFVRVLRWVRLLLLLREIVAHSKYAITI